MSFGDFVTEAEQIAREAGALLRDFYGKGVATEYKGDVDLVTEADRASEELIVSRLRRAFPDHGIIGEEGTREQMNQQFRWYIDPLDGTTNFAHGFPVFCVSMGLESRAADLPDSEDGTMVAGVIYDPLRDEMFAASAGSGAMLNGRAMHVSKITTLGEALVSTGFPSRKRHGSANIHFYQQFTLRSHGARRAGSAALDLAYVACGRTEAFWEFTLNPWDTAAGALLVKEAGGTMTSFSGEPFQLASREVLATNGLILEEVLALFDRMFHDDDMGDIPTAAEYAATRKPAT